MLTVDDYKIEMKEDITDELRNVSNVIPQPQLSTRDDKNMIALGVSTLVIGSVFIAPILGPLLVSLPIAGYAIYRLTKKNP